MQCFLASLLRGLWLHGKIIKSKYIESGILSHIQRKGILKSQGAFLREKNMFDYYGSKWKEKRKKILRKDGYKCQIARMYGRTEEAVVVHHIYPADKYPEYAWCDWNLISVSLASHNKLENRKTGELTELGKQLMRRTKPGVDWRKKRDAH